MKKRIKLALIGYGQRGKVLLDSFKCMSDVEIVAGCDKYQDRTDELVSDVEKAMGNRPFGTTDYKEITKNCDLDGVIIATDWNVHMEISMYFMEAGIPVGCEVGGADSLEEIWELVRCYRRTGTEYMMLENTCYDRREMMLLNMIKQGLFGEIVHCDGGYRHYLCDEILGGKENRHYRLNNYIHRNCDNYPTHPIGPIAKYLGINHGNRFLSLTSTASKQVGLQAYIQRYGVENKELIGKKFNQGDMITTTIKCSNGETITLRLCTTLPCHYSMNMNIFATGGYYHEETKTVVLLDEGVDIEKQRWREFWGNEEEYYEKYGHPLWTEYLKSGVIGGHGGCDYLTLRAYIESVKTGTKPPIDVYDAAAWLSIIPLSQMSIANGSQPVAFPDFTYGQWIEPYEPHSGKYSLDMIVDDPSVKVVPQ